MFIIHRFGCERTPKKLGFLNLLLTYMLREILKMAGIYEYRKKTA